MKILLSFLLIFTSLSALSKEKSRKVSNSSYFTCFLEREGLDKKAFRRQYNFPFPTEVGESYELKGSMRWNDYKILFHQDGKVVIKIKERISGLLVEVEKTHNLGKDPQYESFKVQVDLKNKDIVIPYTIQCGPE